MASPNDFWISEAVRIGKWFKGNCEPCSICGELTCHKELHSAMHVAQVETQAAIDVRLAEIEARVTALENPPA